MMLFRVALAIAALVGADVREGLRVRSSHAYIRAMIAEAQVRSPTFRALVEAIEATDGIVYVEEGDCPFKLRACLAPSITTAGPFRLLRAFVDARVGDWQAMSDIGHELQHALEILRDPTARTDASAFYVYFKANVGTTNVYETEEAVQAGTAVKKEVKAFASKKRP